MHSECTAIGWRCLAEERYITSSLGRGRVVLSAGGDQCQSNLFVYDERDGDAPADAPACEIVLEADEAPANRRFA